MEKDIEKAICKAESEKEEAKDWTSIWGKRYPVLLSYPSRINSEPYEERLGSLLDEIGKEGVFGRLDSYLVLKDILWKFYRKEKKKGTAGRRPLGR